MAAACRVPTLTVVYRAWKGGLGAVVYGEASRLIHTSSAASRKNVIASGPEKYTEAFIKKQIEEFSIGKRHLANMMGEDPETFTQEDIDKAIAYLFPSGLFEKRARPIMKHPELIFPKQLAIQWGEDKRPFHFLFYTGKQEYYSLMHDTHGKFLSVQAYGDEINKGLNGESVGKMEPSCNLRILQGITSKMMSPLQQAGDMAAWRWLTKEELERIIIEQVSDQDNDTFETIEPDGIQIKWNTGSINGKMYQYFIQTMERLVSLPHSRTEEEYVRQYCRKLEIQTKKEMVKPLQYDEHGRAFSTAEGKRKTSEANVVLRENGKGSIIINGEDYLYYFPVLQDREQLMFPFQFLDRLMMYDTECTVSGGGRSSQAGAIRLAVSRALLSFVSEDQVEAMRQAGLLTMDPRRRERKKPGQEGARRKFTWKKR